MEINMRKIITKLVACLALSTAATTQALPIVQADAFSVGDNKAALETGTGLVWMDFGVNQHYSYSQVVSKLNTEYLGWRLPTQSEVINLWSGLFSTMPGWLTNTGIGFIGSTSLDSEFDNIFAVFGSGLDSTNITTDMNTGVTETWTARSGFGVFKFDSGNFGMVSMESPYDAVHVSEALYLDLHGVDASDWYGTMLVKNTNVPEPSSVILLGFGLLLVRRRAYK